MVRLKEVVSSNISQVGYEITKADEGLGILTVKFANGAVYEYDDVPEAVGAEIFTVESVGKFFFQQVRNYFSGRRVDDFSCEDK